MAYHGDAGAFGARSRRGGDDDEGDVAAAVEVFDAGEGQQVACLLREHEAHALGRIDDGSAADGHECISPHVAVE